MEGQVNNDMICNVFKKVKMSDAIWDSDFSEFFKSAGLCTTNLVTLEGLFIEKIENSVRHDCLAIIMIVHHFKITQQNLQAAVNQDTYVV